MDNEAMDNTGGAKMGRTGGMGAGWRRPVALAVLVATSAGSLVAGTAAAAPTPAAAPPAAAAPAAAAPAAADADARLARLPLRFEANQGQTDPQVRFVARAPGYTLFLTPTEAVFALARPGVPTPAVTEPGRAGDDAGGEDDTATADVVRMRLAGANLEPRVEGVDPLPGVTNYLIGSAAGRWRTGVASYAKVRYQGVYPGIDLVFYGVAEGLEYDFEVAPGADPSAIALAFEGAEPTVDAGGDLVLATASGEVRQRRPVLYQRAAGGRRELPGSFEVRGGRVGFSVGPYDRSRPLVIDPVVVYSTYLGGQVSSSGSTSSSDAAQAITVDGGGHAYVTGYTNSLDFPVTAGSAQTVIGGGADAFVAKLNPSGTALVWATYLGGSDSDVGRTVAIDKAEPGCSASPWQCTVYVGGRTSSANFPVANAYDPLCGTPSVTCSYDKRDAFVARLSAAGSALSYSTYLGGSGSDVASGIAVASPGTAWVTGDAETADFPTRSSTGGFGGAGDAFLARIDTTRSGDASLVSSRFLGGSGVDRAGGIALDGAGNPHLAMTTASVGLFTSAGARQTAPASGQDAYVVRLDTTAATLTYATYLGGGSDDSALAVAVHTPSTSTQAHIHVGGYTKSTNFPVANAFQGAHPAAPCLGDCEETGFVARLDPSISGAASLAYASYLGPPRVGQNEPYASVNAVAVDGAGDTYVTGIIYSPDFPVKNPVQSWGGGGNDAFVAQLRTGASAQASLVYYTYLGGSFADSGDGIAVDGSANAYVTGVAGPGLATKPSPGAIQTRTGDSTAGFVAKLGPGVTPVVSAVSPRSGPTSGGSVVTVTGSALSGAKSVRMASTLGSTVVTTTPCPPSPAAPCFSVVNDTQLTLVTPPHADGRSVEDSLAHVVVTLASGVASLPATSSAYLYGEGAFGAEGSCPGAPCKGQSAVRLANGRVLLMEPGPAASRIYDPATGTWSTTGACPTCGDASSVTLLPNGKVLVAGGYVFGEGGGVAIKTAVLYDPASGQWSQTAAMGSTRAFHTATLLADGKVLVAGGCLTNCGYGSAEEDPQTTAEVFDPGTNTWRATGSMGIRRDSHKAVLLDRGVGPCVASPPPGHCGKVLVMGGQSGGYMGLPNHASAEVYDANAIDPVSGARGAWAHTTSMAQARRGHSATLLLDGRVLVVGGVVDERGEVYDPAAGTWSNTNPMYQPRSGHRATLLANGKVLLVGGGGADLLASKPARHDLAELYDPATNSVISGGLGIIAPSAVTALMPGTVAACGTRCGRVLVTPSGTPSPPALYTPRPALSGIAPSTAPGGTTITLTGTGLAAVDKVRFGTVSTTALTHDATSPDTVLRVTVPTGTVGTTVDVVATSAGGASVITPAARFTFSLPKAAVADFNGDGDTERSVYRNGAWYVEGQTTQFLGNSTDIPVPADYNGDGDTERAVYRNGGWYVEGQTTVFFGLSTDIPVPADYTGDGKADRAVFRPSSGAWYVQGQATVYYGRDGDIPTPGDYTGDAKADRAVWRPANGGWYVSGQATAYLGRSGDIPTPGDYTGDAKADRAVWRPANGGWYVAGQATVYLGSNGDVPSPGRYNADATTDRAVWRPGNGGWYVAGQATVYFGTRGDIPLPLPQAIYRFFTF